METDVWMSRDGVLVVCHDKNFIRVCGKDNLQGERLVKDTDLLDFPKFQDKIPIHFSKNDALEYHIKEGID